MRQARQVARIELFINPESRESSVTADDRNGNFTITINGGDGHYQVKDVADFQTTLAHELGHVIALITKDASHDTRRNFAQRVDDSGIGVHQLNIGAEHKAWEFAREIWPDLNEDSARNSLGSYYKSEEYVNKYGIAPNSPAGPPAPIPQEDVIDEEPCYTSAVPPEDYWAGSKLSTEELVGLATLLASPVKSEWHNVYPQSFLFDAVDDRKETLNDINMFADVPTLPEPSFDDFGRWEDDGGMIYGNYVSGDHSEWLRPHSPTFDRFMEEWATQNMPAKAPSAPSKPESVPNGLVPPWFWEFSFLVVLTLALISLCCELAYGFAEVL